MELSPEPKFTTISVKFDNSDILYTYKCDLNFGIIPGDTVVVKTDSGQFKLVKVKSVHETPRPDNDRFVMKWIHQRVNP